MKLDDRYFYNPEIEYYFLSVLSTENSPCWIRRPFLTKVEVDDFIKYEYLPRIEFYKNLEIYPESLLRVMINVSNGSGDLLETDIRTWLFDDRYSSKSTYYENIIKRKIGIRHKSGFKQWEEITGFDIEKVLM